MGNVWCCRPNSFIIDYTHRKVVISQGIQCTLLMPASNCHHIYMNKQPLCTPQRHCRCGITVGCGDCKMNEGKENVTKDFLKSPQKTLKSKIKKPNETFISEHPDALVSLSETFSESSLEEFLSRKRLSQQIKPNLTKEIHTKLLCLPEIETSELLNSSFHKPINNSSEAVNKFTNLKRNRRKNRTRKRRKTGKVNNTDTSSSNSLSTDRSAVDNLNPDLNNSAETTSIEDSRKTNDTMYSLVTPKKSILKNSDAHKEMVCENRDENEKPNANFEVNSPLERHGNLSLHSDKYSNGSLPHRSLSAMSNHDSLDQLMSLLKSSTFAISDEGLINKPKKSKSNDCINKSVNFTTDVTNIKPFNELQPKPIAKTGYQIQTDGKIKKRLILRETHKLFDILNDPNDRRIRAICDRYQCDLEIFVRPPKIGLMYFAVEILAPDKYSLRMCVRELDSSMKWCISSQLF